MNSIVYFLFLLLLFSHYNYYLRPAVLVVIPVIYCRCCAFRMPLFKVKSTLGKSVLIKADTLAGIIAAAVSKLGLDDNNYEVTNMLHNSFLSQKILEALFHITSIEHLLSCSTKVFMS